MIPIDVRKFNLPKRIQCEHCTDESVRFISYTTPTTPNDYITMQRRPSYYGESTEYSLSVHLPEQRRVEILATVAHTSVNCWKMSVSKASGSDFYSFKTLNEVSDELKRVFV